MNAEHRIIDSIIDAARYLNMARVALASAVWRDHQCADEELGRHLDALNVHIDNAIGRVVKARLRVIDQAYAARLSDARQNVLLVPTGEPNTYRVPDAHEGLPITRALGRCCSGDTLVTDRPSPSCLLEQRLSDGKPYWVCVHF